MLFHVELRTDDPELIRALQGVRNRARFVSMALKHFVSTTLGRETLSLMSIQKPGRLDGPKKKKNREARKVLKPGLPEAQGRDIRDLDEFF